MEALLKNLDIAKHNIQQNDFDFLMLNAGVEGSGKSTLALHICRYIDPEFTEEKIFFDNETFFTALKTMPRYSAVLLDEGAEALYSRQFATKENIRLNKLLMRVRYKNLFLCINIPDFAMIDNYIRNFRCRALTRVLLNYNQETGDWIRGHFKFYSWDKVKKIHRSRMTGFTMYPKPSFEDHFPKFGDEQLWQAYLNKKMDYCEEQENEGKKEVCPYCGGTTFTKTLQCSKCGLQKSISLIL